MSDYKTKFVSLALKNAIVYIILIVVSSVLIGYFLYRKSSAIIVNSSIQQLEHDLEVLDVRFISYIEQIRQDILYLSRSPYLNDYLIAPNDTQKEFNKVKLSNDYFSFLSTKPDYGQLRFIANDSLGLEKIRTDRLKGHIFIVPSDALQRKGSSAYFRETILLPKDSVYFSEIDLNKEYGKISYPIMPTLRAACPLYVNGKVEGIIILNTILNNFFEHFKKSVHSNSELYLFNDIGHFIIHPDSTKEFGFEYAKLPYAPLEFKLPLDFLTTIGNDVKRIETKTHIYYFKKINYPRTNYSLYICLGAAKDVILSPFYDWQWSVLVITLIIILLLVFLALFWMRKQTNGLESITKSMISFPNSLSVSDLPLNRNDEIGLLANTFQAMSWTLQQNIQSLADAKASAESANKSKELFLENMSHEIRNPLHSIVGMTRMLEDNHPRTDQLPFIETLKFSTHNLLSLVNDILDFSKLKEGKIQLLNEPVQFYDLINKIYKSYIFEAVSKKISFKLICDEELKNLWVKLDALRFSQVLSNLISNAIKFTPEYGHVELNIKNEIKNDHSVSLVILVKDSGIGIRLENYKLILERFQKENRQDYLKNESGAGLGLPIVVQLLELFGSTLKLDSTFGEGSIFSFEIILESINNPGSYTISKESQFSFFEIPRSILIIEDDPQLRMLYQRIFENGRNTIKQVSQSLEIGELESDLKYDLIITDFWLEKVSLFDIFEKIFSFKKPDGLFIAVTGHHDIDAVLKSSHYLLDMVIQKPISPDKMISEIEYAFTHKEFQIPTLEVLYKDYDYDPTLILSALKLLINEWKDAREQLSKAILSCDTGLKDAVVHKLANSLRRFNLVKLENQLVMIKLEPFVNSKQLESTNRDIQVKMHQCEMFFENELKKWL